jgi:hypothetical protein
MFMFGCCVGNLVSPQIWVPSAAPRYYGAWVSQIDIAWVGTPAILLVIWFILLRRNAERENSSATFGEDERQRGYVEETNTEGGIARVKYSVAVLTLPIFKICLTSTRYRGSVSLCHW